MTYKNFFCADNNESGKVRRIGFYNIMVALWQNPFPFMPSTLLCLGVLIRPNRLFVTTQCASMLKSFCHIRIEFGGYAVHEVQSPKTRIVSKEEVSSPSKFSILHVSNFTE